MTIHDCGYSEKKTRFQTRFLAPHLTAPPDRFRDHRLDQLDQLAGVSKGRGGGVAWRCRSRGYLISRLAGRAPRLPLRADGEYLLRCDERAAIAEVSQPSPRESDRAETPRWPPPEADSPLRVAVDSRDPLDTVYDFERSVRQAASGFPGDGRPGDDDGRAGAPVPRDLLGIGARCPQRKRPDPPPSAAGPALLEARLRLHPRLLAQVQRGGQGPGSGLLGPIACPTQFPPCPASLRRTCAEGCSRRNRDSSASVSGSEGSSARSRNAEIGSSASITRYGA